MGLIMPDIRNQAKQQFIAPIALFIWDVYPSGVNYSNFKDDDGNLVLPKKIINKKFSKAPGIKPINS